MNLLHDLWIPVLGKNEFQHVSYQDFLCGEGDITDFGFNRDDLNLATLQLLISLTQIIFMPQNTDEVRRREQISLTKDEYLSGVAAFTDWFEMQHPEMPFMQSRGVQASAPTAIQKLFPGLPEGNNHAMFNSTDEVRAACESCVAIALFNQALNCPGFGGGFKDGLRGRAPINTFVKGATLRQTVWRNILSKDWILQSQVGKLDNAPTWVKPIQPNETIPAQTIGLARGLFWQPARIEVFEWRSGDCSVCGGRSLAVTSGFRKEKFSFSIIGTWTHPHSPRQWEVKDKDKELKEGYLSFTASTPAWTQLAAMLTDVSNPKKEGSYPAQVIVHFSKAFDLLEPLDLIVGGYRNNQAAIIDRRHELYSLAHGWKGNTEFLRDIIADAIDIKDALQKTVFGFGKNIGVPGLSRRAEEAFFYRSEAVIHKVIREMDWKEFATVRDIFAKTLCRQARAIFEELTEPYRTEPKMLKALMISRRSLEKKLKKLTSGGYT